VPGTERWVPGTGGRVLVRWRRPLGAGRL